MFKILTLNAISATGLSQFPKNNYEVSSELSTPDAILVRSQNMHTMTMPDSVKIIGRAGAGVNNIPISMLTEQGIPVLNTPGANANAVRELVLAGMLIACRHICQSWDYVRQLNGTNTEIETRLEKDKKQFVGTELLGKTLGLVGLGNVGVKVANAAIHLGMKVVGYDPTISVNRAWELSSDVKQAHQLTDLLRDADYISFHVPLTAETKNMIDTPRLQMMKDGVVLLNFSRAGIVDDQALLDALNHKKVSAYITDFPNPILKEHPQVICLPHLGASTKEAEENCAVMIVKQVRDFLENGSIINSVNFPEVVLPKNAGTERLSIVNKNIPNMVAQISLKLAAAKLNIVELVNKSREEIAYTLIDVNQSVSDALLKDLATIDGVVKVRKII